MPSHAKSERIAFDQSIYAKRYNPPDQMKLQKQLTSLDNFLDLCTKNNITVLLVDMPITEANRNMIDPNLLQAWQSGVESCAQRYGAEYADLDCDENYDESDFDDSVHLSASGGRKFFSDLADLMAEDNDLVKALHLNVRHTVSNLSDFVVVQPKS